MIEIDPPARAQVVPAEVPGLAALLSLAVGVVSVAALYLARDVLVPIMLAILLSFILSPVVELLQRLRLPRVPSVVLAVVIALSVAGVLATVMGTQVASLATDAPRYAVTIRHKVREAQSSTIGQLPAMIGALGRQFDRASGGLANPVRVVTGPRALRTAPPPLPVEVRTPPLSPIALMRAVLAPVIGPLETTGIVVIVAIFILLQREDLRDRLIRIFGATDLHRTTTAMDDAASRLSRYFLTQVAINALFGTIIGSGLYFIGVPSPALWGVLAGLLRFLPYIGPVLAAIPPLILAAAVGPDWAMSFWVIGLFLVVEPIMGYVVEPMVYGHSTGLSPVAVIVSAIFWTWLWGPIGLILSTPLTLCLVVLGRHVKRLEFLDVMLGDRPALTPVESFYQRMLAGDPDEALDQAEALLRDRSLSSYYDEVVVKGLQMAAADCLRGVLDDARLDRVRRAARALIADLAGHDDSNPPPARGTAPNVRTLAEKALPATAAPIAAVHPLTAAWQANGAILCVAGRGPLDEVGSSILAQLLDKHDLGSRTATYAEVSRDRIAELDVSGVLAVAVTYLDLDGNPAHLRTLLRRLHDQLPGVPVTVGLWRRGENEQESPDADQVAGNLREMVIHCRDIAEAGGAADRDLMAAFA
ncbi:AI-2E family transporter [Polymorphobacter sp. PAMC 29334]|uniref:AI-2E family transporter n=1 Tax=Polymorphobacter sp. PAMC 29334 TaxID=2862331 RepID=UPI001C681B2E|nr:AI-2E family transporter [Polymorphobacter sp. PAMC 29334]QYE36463.1 AI-2E family transporter [Polymorphobacter sp. PAMC 29334]